MPLSRLPPLSSLRAFEAAARRGSIKEAAAELGVTPGAVSQQIKSLETDLGVALFVRKTRAIHLTPAGQQLQPTISDAFLQIRQVVDHVRPKTTPKFRIHATNALISKWLLPRLHRFTAEHPDVQVHIESMSPQGAGSGSVADIEIWYGTDPPQGMYWELLHQERLLVVASPSFLQAHAIAQPKDIWTAPAIHDTTLFHAGSLSSWDLWAKHAGLARVVDPTKALNFERPPGGQIVDAAIAGAGIAICGSLLVYSALADGRLVCPFGPIIDSERSYYLCCRPGREKDVHVKEFLSWAHKEAAVLTTLNALQDGSV